MTPHSCKACCEGFTWCKNIEFNFFFQWYSMGTCLTPSK
jgi:hypothetical protein